MLLVSILADDAEGNSFDLAFVNLNAGLLA